MQIIRDSNLEEYAKCFWLREQAKNGHGGGDDPLGKLAREHHYKLPFKRSDPAKVRMQILRLEGIRELEELVIHDYMVEHPWMKERGIKANSRKLGDLANIFLQYGYFEKPSQVTQNDAQYRNFHAWRKSGSFRTCMDAENRSLIQYNGVELEIVDGWGRLLPFVALIKGGMPFCPVECFLASERSEAGSPLASSPVI